MSDIDRRTIKVLLACLELEVGELADHIGYEALFSPEEWYSIMSGEWSGPDDWGSPKEGTSETKHSVTVTVVHDGYVLDSATRATSATTFRT